MFLRLRLYRWSIYRIVIVTALIWIIIGFSVMVYYMDCLGSNGINCVGGKQRKLYSDSEINSALSGGGGNVNVNPYYSDSLIAPSSNGDSSVHSSVLPAYKLTELRRWQAPVINSNPRSWPGENGKAVVIAKEEEALKNEKFKLNQFNLLASDRIALNRTLPDVRMKACKNKKLPDLLPATSIVIVFHNEAWSTLLRTVWSIIRTSPRSLLEEILLVDDASERG